MFFTLVFGDNFLILANCVCDERCRENLAPASPNGLNSLLTTVMVGLVIFIGNRA